LFIALWSYVVYGSTSVLTGLMRANGTVLWPTAIGIGAIWAVEIPSAWLLSNGPLGLSGVWVAFPLAFVAAFLAAFAYYRWVWSPHVGESERLVP
jgi:Na+-driven multidrug efflux pump